jgi:hypothetical protein
VEALKKTTQQEAVSDFYSIRMSTEYIAAAGNLVEELQETERSSVSIAAFRSQN